MSEPAGVTWTPLTRGTIEIRALAGKPPTGGEPSLRAEFRAGGGL